MEEYESVTQTLDDTDAILGFLSYLERTYIGKKVGRTTKPAKIPIASWNHYTTILREESTTNNSSEGANSAWAGSLPTNASLFTVLQTFIEVCFRS